MIPDDVPEDRCGFTFEAASGPSASCCYRRTWGSHDVCIWHADVSGEQKPVDDLKAARTPERIRDLNSNTGPSEILDGARLSGTTFPTETDFEGVFLRGADLSGVVLREADCSAASMALSNLEGADFRESTLPELDCRAAMMSNADLRSTKLTDADLFDADLREAYLLDADITRGDLRHADATEAVFKGSALEDALIDAGTFEMADLRETNLRGAEMVEIQLSEASLDDATLDGADLIDANLTKASLKTASLKGTNLDQATLTRADLQQAELTRAELLAADLAEVNLLGADLTLAFLVEADLHDSYLVDATLEEANLQSAILNGSRIQHADLREATLLSAALRDTNLYEAVLDEADLEDADLTDASLANASLVGANLERAVFTQADLFNADLRYSRFYGAVFAEARITNETTFDNRCVYDPRSESQVEESNDDVDRLTKAAGAYQELEKLCRENALANQQSHYFVRRQDIYRLQHKQSGRYGRAITARAARMFTLYGESPWRVIATSAVVILLCGLAYPLLGGVALSSGGEPLTIFKPMGTPLAQLPGGTWLANLYFSLVTFTTLGYGDIQPASAPVQLLAGIESLIGASLLALLVAVLARRITR